MKNTLKSRRIKNKNNVSKKHLKLRKKLKISSKIKKTQRGGTVTRESIAKQIRKLIDDILIEYDDRNDPPSILFDFIPDDIRGSVEHKMIRRYKEEKKEYVDFSNDAYKKASTDYNDWVEKTFFSKEEQKFIKENEEKESNYKTDTHIRIIRSDKTNGSSQPHREFQPGNFAPYKYNIICYYSIENCQLENCGLGLIYKSKSGALKVVVLPVIDGLTLKIRDKYFYHFTPPLKPIKEGLIERILIRDYYFNQYEKSTMSEKEVDDFMDTNPLEKL